MQALRMFRESSFKQSRAWVGASLTPGECAVLCRRLVKRHSSKGVAAILAVPEFVLGRWCGGKARPKPTERRLIWFTYAALMHPELVRSPADILTCGRYVSKRFGGPMVARVGDESADWLAWCWEI